MVIKVESKHQELGHVCDPPKSGRPPVAEDDQINVLLAVHENHYSTLNG